MKKALIAILTALFLFNCTGAGLIWLCQIESHRSAVFSNKKHGELVSLHYSSSKENNEKYVAGKEFESNGKRYDIVSVTKSGDELILLCYDDTTEKEMLNELGKTTDSQQNSKEKNSAQKKSAVDYLLSDFQSFAVAFSSSEFISEPEHFTSSAPRSIPAPPPWFV